MTVTVISAVVVVATAFRPLVIARCVAVIVLTLLPLMILQLAPFVSLIVSLRK